MYVEWLLHVTVHLRFIQSCIKLYGSQGTQNGCFLLISYSSVTGDQRKQKEEEKANKEKNVSQTDIKDNFSREYFTEKIDFLASNSAESSVNNIFYREKRER